MHQSTQTKNNHGDAMSVIDGLLNRVKNQKNVQVLRERMEAVESYESLLQLICDANRAVNEDFVNTVGSFNEREKKKEHDAKSIKYVKNFLKDQEFSDSDDDETSPTFVYNTKVKEGDDIVKVFKEAYEEIVVDNPQGFGDYHFEIFMDELRENGFDCVIQRKDKNEDKLCDCCSHKCRRCENCNQEKTVIECGNGALICGNCGY